MTTKEKKINKSKPEDGRDSKEEKLLILHNDDKNTFDFVIETLIDICGHNSLQAEQCALITHYKGKCDVRKGTYEVLQPMKEKLVSKGFSATLN
ncbi:MAG: ATP-dependent Clp protease adaptor ClpS [Bacteroidia bacterium]|nr:ATP-dependent Clp protease adaptor ClpS [Bacteroidia bacterium]